MASLISEVLQQLQKGGTGLWSDTSSIGDEDFEMGKTSPQLESDSNNAVVTQPKRLQVPKACSNCRKMHAGCDTERPCRRCKQNGLESSCIDVPRKKRISRKKSKLNGLEEVETIRVEDVTNLKTEDSNNSSDAGGYWEETYNELFSGIVPNTPTATFNPSTAIEPFNPYGFEPEPLILTEMTDSVSIPTNNSPYNALSLTNMVEFPQTPPQLQQTTSPSNYTNDLSFLVQQIKELHDSNRNLETKLLGVTSELVEMRNASVTENTEKALAPILGGWHSFSPQQELAISVWRVQQRGGDGCASNVLVEANTKFIQLLGYSMDVLRNNFVCTNMIRKQDLCPDSREQKCSSRDWPKRTQIITAYGLKDVFITITPIQENKMGSPRFFLVYILEVQ